MACDPPSIQTILMVGIAVGLTLLFIGAIASIGVWVERMTR